MADSMLATASDVQGQDGGLVQETSSKPKDPIRETKCLGLLEGVPDREHRIKLLYSWLITLAFLTLGLLAGQFGTTLVDLQIITGTDLGRASAFITGVTAGYMSGAFFSGAVFDKVNPRLLIFTGLFGLGVTSIISPYCRSYTLMIFIRTLCGFFGGIVDSSGNTWHMKIWRSEGTVLMQIIHFSFALGGVLSPLYTEPFLAKRIVENETDIHNVTGNSTESLAFGNLSDEYVASDPRTTNVYYAFLVSGVLTILISIPFVVLFIKQRSPNIQNNPEQDDNTKITYRELPFCFHLFLLATICCFFMLYSSLEGGFSYLLMAFLINEFDSITKSECVYITTVYWVSFAMSRFLMIFVSKVLSPVQLLSLCILLMVLSFTGFFISVLFEEIVAIAVFTAMAGLGMSAVFATGFSWTEIELLKVTARVSASITVTGCLATSIIPLILGFLMEKVNNRWFCYLWLCQTALICLIFIFLSLFNRLYINKVYGSVILVEHGVDNEKRQHLIEHPREEC